MCGIGGIIVRSENKIDNLNSFLNEKIKIISDSQIKRGPDSSKIITGNDFAFSHNRLSIIDLSENGAQPMEIDNWLIVFNGEIYNYKSLKEILISKNISFIGDSDTEVLLKYFLEFGIDSTLEQINGIFAFCIYNKFTGEFYAARDRIGEKPFFYYLDDFDNFYFSSNPAAIVKSLLEKEWFLDKEALWEFFELGGFFTEKTLFKGIKRLDSATIIKGDKNKLSISKYWQPKFVPNLSEQDVINQVKKSIFSRTVSDVPIVLFLSGGVDSSAVAAVLKDIQAVHLFSPEVEHAKLISNLFNIDLKIIKPSDFDVRQTILDYCEFAGEPTMAGFVPYITSKSVSETHKVALTANGADELFFGYVRIPTPDIDKNTYLKRKEKSKLHVDRAAGTHKEQIFHIFRHPSNFKIPILNKNKTEEDLYKLLDENISKLNSDFPKSAQYRWFELMTYVKGDLNLTLDYSSMANSLEVRAPFLDHDLVEFALSIDENHHISKNLGRKHILKTILESEGVPSSIWNREKLGFSLIASYKESIDSLKDEALSSLERDGFLIINSKNFEAGRDREYLRTSGFGFYCWKTVWIDSGIVKV